MTTPIVKTNPAAKPASASRFAIAIIAKTIHSAGGRACPEVSKEGIEGSVPTLRHQGKHRDCAEVGIASIRVDLPGSATQADVEAPSDLYARVRLAMLDAEVGP